MDDATITKMVRAAESYIFNSYGILTTTTEVETYFRAFPLDLHLRFACYPIISLTRVQYFTLDSDTPTEIPRERFAAPGLILNPPTITHRSAWPTVDRLASLAVQFSGGWGPAAASIPPAIQHAILLLVAAYYENRPEFAATNAIRSLPIGVDALLVNHRVW
jgi:uncharacterized phiE125 gp8 family phage protein